MKRLLVISACSGKKNAPPHAPMPSPKEIETLGIRIVNDERFSKFKKKAIDMYAGLEHLKISQSMKKIWQTYGYNFAELRIISAAFGMLKWNDEIIPYNVKFNEKCASYNRTLGIKLSIPHDFDCIVTEYDIVFVILGIPYLYSLNLPRKLPLSPTIVFFSSEKYTNLIPHQKNIFHIPAGSSLAKKTGKSPRTIKGILFERIAHEIIKEKNFLDLITSKPTAILTLLEDFL